VLRVLHLKGSSRFDVGARVRLNPSTVCEGDSQPDPAAANLGTVRAVEGPWLAVAWDGEQGWCEYHQEDLEADLEGACR